MAMTPNKSTCLSSIQNINISKTKVLRRRIKSEVRTYLDRCSTGIPERTADSILPGNIGALQYQLRKYLEVWGNTQVVVEDSEKKDCVDEIDILKTHNYQTTFDGEIKAMAEDFNNKDVESENEDVEVVIAQTSVMTTIISDFTGDNQNLESNHTTQKVQIENCPSHLDFLVFACFVNGGAVSQELILSLEIDKWEQLIYYSFDPGIDKKSDSVEFGTSCVRNLTINVVAAALYDPGGSDVAFASDTGDDVVMARWLQSASLQYFAYPLASTCIDQCLLTNLLMQCYEVHSAKKKQRLLKLLRNLNFSGESGSDLYIHTTQTSGELSTSDVFCSPKFKEDFWYSVTSNTPKSVLMSLLIIVMKNVIWGFCWRLNGFKGKIWSLLVRALVVIVNKMNLLKGKIWSV
ncbi:hypothetical protein ACFE04_002331 [Oxalis oulophora]